MFKILYLFFLLLSGLYARDLQPINTIQASGLVTDLVEDKGLLYIATDAGVVDIIDLRTQARVSQIKLAPMKTALGDLIPSRILSIDRFQNKTLLVTTAANAYREIWLIDGNTPRKIIDASKRLMVKRAFFTEKGKVVLGTFGSDIGLYDSDEGYHVYRKHISESTMGGMVLSRDKKKMLLSDESGTVRLIDILSAKIEKTFSSQHVDNIYSVAYAQGLTITAGQDRRVGVYPKDGDAYHIKSDFLVYCVGLSPSGKIGAYSSGVAHDLQLFNTKTKAKIHRLKGHFATPNKIMFLNENILISSGDEAKVYFWKLD